MQYMQFVQAQSSSRLMTSPTMAFSGGGSRPAGLIAWSTAASTLSSSFTMPLFSSGLPSASTWAAFLAAMASGACSSQ